MSVSVRSNGLSRHSAVLRDTAAQNVLQSSRHSNTDTKFHPRRTSTVDNKNTAVITLDDLNRIRAQCTTNTFAQSFQGDFDEEAMRTRERQELQEKSKARIAQWPNTIQAMRKKREEERYKRLEEEELERRRIDATEYALQQETRMLAVEKANKHAYACQDQVKAFKSKLLMSDVLAEREVQQAVKKRKAEHEKRVEQEWLELDNAKMEAFDEKVKQKLIDEYERKMSNAKVIHEQLHEFKMKYIKRMQDEILEAELINRQVKEELAREADKDAERKKKALQQMDAFKRANQELQAQQAQLSQKERDEEAKVEEYARQKAALDQLKKDKEEQKFREKQETRQRLIERQAEILRNMKNREDEILNKQVEEAEEKALALFEEKERRRQELKQAIEKSRDQQKEKQRRERAAEEQEQQEFEQFWKLRSEELQVAEMQERDEARQRNEELKQYLKRQIEVKHKKAEEDFKAELDQATRAVAVVDEQQRGFYSYAEEALKTWGASGKNVKPLILELKSYKKRVF